MRHLNGWVAVTVRVLQTDTVTLLVSVTVTGYAVCKSQQESMGPLGGQKGTLVKF